MDCWDCETWHPDAEGAAHYHTIKREFLEDELNVLQAAPNGNPETAETISRIRAQLDEQDRIIAYLQNHDELPPRQVSL